MAASRDTIFGNLRPFNQCSVETCRAVGSVIVLVVVVLTLIGARCGPLL